MKANATKAVHVKKESVWLGVHKEVLVSRIKIHYAFAKKNFYSYETATHFKIIYF